MKNEDTKVSIIVTIFNVEKYLPKCIDSIIQQTHKNIEIILVDDGSPDKCPQICEDYKRKDDRIVTIHKKNAGVSAARNSGLDIATGKYICFADGDDYLMEDYIEYLLDMAVDNAAEISLTTEMFTNYQNQQTLNTHTSIRTGEDATEGILCYRIPIGVYCKLFDRQYITEYGLRFIEEIFMGEGFNFNTAAFQRADKVVIGNRKVYFYRQDNPTSATTLFSERKWNNGLYAIDRIENDLHIKSDRICKALKYARWHTCSDAYDMMVLAKAETLYPALYEYCLEITKRDSKIGFSVPCSRKEKIRSLIFSICPRVMPLLISLRRKMHGVKI